MPLRYDLMQPGISPLVREEGNIAGQPGGGPLADRSQFEEVAGKRYRGFGQETADLAGAATVDLGYPNLGYCWMVERMAVIGGGTAAVFVGTIDDSGFVDFTPAGTQDVADMSSPIYVPGGQNLFVVFTGAGAGTVCSVTTQVGVLREGS